MSTTIADEFQVVIRIPKVDKAPLKPEDTLWGQMLYSGPPDIWMTPEPSANEIHEIQDAPDEDGEPILGFRLPSFFFDPDFTGDADLPPPENKAPRSLRGAVKYRLHPHPSAAPHMRMHAFYALTPPTWVRPPQCPSSCDNSDPEPRTRPSTTPELSTTRTSPSDSESLEEIRKLCALEAEIDREQKIRDAADGRLALPPSPRPRVFVPPATTDENPSSGSQAPSIPPSPAASDRSTTPFRIIPPLPARFPSFFGRHASSDGRDADVTDRTFCTSVESDY
ncbi:hypothetical protein MVEN_02222800 [Mycena venus]|uniref:Uncharacterized protein n=1 Tax=Mycena venus TaxID=2733690 RepID=A0A8H6X7R1_9AGAR|nr:hypothetical protein MVEN_02222800 [Mycena venus]